jgi:Contractile injection system tube protein/LysM domain
MGLEKLTIVPENAPLLPEIEALFNPERYTVNKSVHFAEITIPGLDSPVQQFVNGQSEKITMELFFDTTEFGMVDDPQDVRSQTGLIYQLLRVDGDLHAPPRCMLSWGDGGRLFCFGTSNTFWCVIESVSEEFTLFSPSGIPLRAKLNLTFREAWTIEQQLQETPRESADHTKTYRVKRGETLSQIAWLQYQDSANWRPIADANKLDNPRLLFPGTKLIVPNIKTGKV